MACYSFLQFSNWLQADEIGPDLKLTGCAVDSRLVEPGNLFFALPGEKTDGHHFLFEAVAKGAVAAVVSKNYSNGDLSIPLIPVENVLDALQILARNLLAERKSKIVAVTGSLGKTTVKEFLTELLKAKYRVGSTPGNSNSQSSLPLTILNQTTGLEEILVLEMGMTHPGNLKRLVFMAPPDIAVITTTALVHACNFDSLEEIGRTKAEIFSHPNTKLGLLDKNIVNFDELCQIGSCQKISFAVEQMADYSLRRGEEHLLLFAPEGRMRLPLLPLPGSHNLHNFLAAAATAKALGMEWEEIALAIPHLKLPERRLQFIEKNGILFINDSYNASPRSLKAALDSLPCPRPGGRKIAVLGGMAELGRFEEESHRDIGNYALDHVDLMFCFGKECEVIRDCWHAAGKPVEWKKNRLDIVERLRPILSEGDVVLLKGSKSKEVWKVLEEL